MDKELIKRTLDDVISRMFRFLSVITLTILSNYYTTYVERDLRQLISIDHYDRKIQALASGDEPRHL